MKHPSQQTVQTIVTCTITFLLGAILGITIDIEANKAQNQRKDAIISSSISLINLVSSDIDDFKDIYGKTDQYKDYVLSKSQYYNAAKDN